MKKINVKGKDYLIPQSWNEITLKMQIQVSRDSEKIDGALKKIAILSGYSGIPLEILKKVHISELNDLFKELFELMNTPIPDMPMIEFDFKGSHYYCGQNLVDMEFQDFISIENIIEEYEGHTFDSMPTILAIMCKRKKDNGVFETIDDYDVRERAKLFEDLPISIANGLSVFFYASVNTLPKISQLYSNPKEMVEMRIKEVESTVKQLDGRGLLMKCVAGILRICIKYIRRKQHKHFTSTRQK